MIIQDALQLNWLIPNMNFINIGCGNTYHTDWVNLDLAATSPDIQIYDLRQGIPYADQLFDACYSSHLLEHLTRDDASNLIAECFRILKPKGIVRVVVPDLENIVRAYLYTLECIENSASNSNNLEMIENYNWIMLELFDQVARGEVGGDMVRYLRKPNLINKSFIKSRIGSEAEQHWNLPSVVQEKPKLLPSWNAVKTKLSPRLTQKVKLKLIKLLIKFVFGKQACQAFEEGVFRNSGEIHRWMYDRVSLRHLLEQTGFVEITICSADQSRIPSFAHYSLDMVEGTVRKPDSLFMEAMKP